MRYSLLYCTFVLLFSFYISAPASAQLRKIYLNPKTVAREKQSRFIDSIKFIPLEVKDGIEYGDNYNVQVTEKYFMLNDQSNKRFMLYTKDGRYVKSVSYKKLGEGFYPEYQEASDEITFFGNNRNYTLTPKDRVQIKMDWDNPRNKKYFKKFTLKLNDPSFTIKKDVPTERDIMQLYHYYDEYYLEGGIAVSPLFKDSIDHELKIYKNNKLVKGFFPYNRINEPRFLFTDEEEISLIRTDTPGIITIARPYNDTIFRLVNDSLFPVCKLVLPVENSLVPAIFTKHFKNRSERENFSRNNGWMLYQIHNFYETPKFIMLSVEYLSNSDSYIYEKQSNVTYKIRNIKADSSQYNLGLFGDFAVERKGSTFYKSQEAGDLITFFDKYKDVPIPKELQNFIKSKPPESTPVIVEYKLKN